MKSLRLIYVTGILGISAYCPFARPDMFGGDIAVLMQIYSNAIQQLIQMRQIFATGSDSLDLMRDINKGIREGLTGMQMMNPRFNPGIYSGLASTDSVLEVVKDLYGPVPESVEAGLQHAQDQSVAESIAMNGSLFRFADQADEESKRIIAHASEVSPQGAAKLTAQSISVLIGVSTQVLRTNSMMLKMMGQDMAIMNRKGKLQSEQFKAQYEGLSQGLKLTKDNTRLGSLNGG